MPEIYLPEKIIFEKNILESFRLENCHHAIIISDSETLKNRGILDNILLKSRKIISQVSLIVNNNVFELYNQAAEAFFAEEADLIVAIGSSAAIDCGMLLTYQCGARFTAIPCCGSSGMTDFENADYCTYRHSPDTVVLDPALAECMPSDILAYDAMASLAYAIDTLFSSDNIITKSLAVRGATGILNNLLPAFRGNTASIEKLMYAMYFTAVAHRNYTNLKDSYINRISRFFADFGYTKSSVCSVILPNVAEYEEKSFRNILSEIAEAAGVSRSGDDPSFAGTKLIDEIRKLQARVGIPRSVSAFNLTETAYQTRRIHSDIPDDLLDLCYYGSFAFMKM